MDLGCGTGELSAYLAELVDQDGKVVAVDPDMLDLKWLRNHTAKSKILHFTKEALQTSQEWVHRLMTSSSPTLCFTGFTINKRPSRTCFAA